jgi:hypothetical protein
MRIEKLKEENDIPSLRERTMSADSGIGISTADLAVQSTPPIAGSGDQSEAAATLSDVAMSGSGKGAKTRGKKKTKRTKERTASVSEENDQQVGSEEKRRSGSTIEQVVVVREVAVAAAPALAKKQSLFRHISKTFSTTGAGFLSPSPPTSTSYATGAEEASPPAPVAPVDVGSLGGATVLLCCDGEKWNGGKLGPYSFDKLVQIVLERHAHIFSSAGQVCLTCPGIKKGGMSVRSDKDLRQLKILAKERQEKVVVLNAHHRQ